MKKMDEKEEKLRKGGWRSRFVQLTSMLMLCFNMLSAPLTAIGIATIAVTTVTLVVSCDKDTPTQGQGQQEEPTPTPQQKHNVELVYGQNPNTQWQNISMDTLNKYNADPTVDTIFMVPETPNQYSTNSTTGLKTLATKLRERHNVNPNKVFGKGDLELKGTSIQSNPEIVRFFADTLRYHVIAR